MPRVRFIDVGRLKMTWEADLPNVDEKSLVREIQRQGALLSAGIEVVNSQIIVGGFRVVGRTELVTE